MGLALEFARQLARPTGRAGQLLGRAMDLANRTPTRLALDLLAPRDGEYILDAGCGTGTAMAQVLQRAECNMTGIDPSVTMVNAARRRLPKHCELHCCDIMGLPQPDRGFDAAMLLNVLYFCDAEGVMVSKLRESLRPGGRLVIYVTHRQTMENWPFATAGLHRLFDRQELVGAIHAGGFARSAIEVHEVTISGSIKGLLALARC